MRNEDSFLVQHMSWSNLDERHEIALAVVADGLGGHEAGDKASGLAIRRIGASLLPLFAEVLNHPQVILPESRLADAVCQAIKEANRLIHRQANEHNDYRGMGATVAVVLIVDSQAVIGHVGDCRVYHQSGEEVTQVTRDQTLVARMVELGQLSEAEALTHPSRHEVIHALGRHADIASAIYDVKLATGDWIVVASDGLHTHLGREALQGAIGNAAPSAIALAHHLVALAEQGGGTDNCTVVAVRSC
jgi:protein phosphatase